MPGLNCCCGENLMKKLLKRVLPQPALDRLKLIRERWLVRYARPSYSQEGEDVILNRFLQDKPSGFFVDIGAHHPKRLSNTYLLYRRGWRGINVDPNPGSMRLFKQIRPRDINVEAAVSSVSQDLTYHAFNEPALNTFDAALAKTRVGAKYHIIQEIKITTQPLSRLLETYLPSGTAIDLLTVDVEGMDYDVLQSNDWNLYVPEFVLVECLGSIELHDAVEDPVGQFLTSHGYAMVAKTMNTVLFQLIRSPAHRIEGL